MNEQKNNGRGIFYGVIGVATLVVAIIGATFAYFTATAGNNVIISADKLGKLKTVLQDIAISVLLVFVALAGIGLSGIFMTILLWIGYATMGLATIVSVVSGVNYCIKNKEVFKG